MIVTPELTRLETVEHIAPPMSAAVTIPLSIDLRHSMMDGYVIYVGHSGFAQHSRDTSGVVKAIAKAVAEHLKTLPAFSV